jgi:hypothetical protein
VLPSPDDLHSLVIRTDFSDESLWQVAYRDLTTQTGMFKANLQFVEDRRYENLTVAELLALAEGSDQTFVFLADRETLTHPEHPLMVVDLFEDNAGRPFRVSPPALWAVQNNLVIGNCDWEDFSESLDPDGIFRGHDR